MNQWDWRTTKAELSVSSLQPQASYWVKRYAPLIPRDGVVLDLACGAGRHAQYLALSGYSVLAVDRDISALQQAHTLRIESQQLDLEGPNWPLAGRYFSGVVVTNYLFRPFLGELPLMLVEGGILIYETFAQGNGVFGKPSNPDFLLNAGELLAFAANHGLKVLAYEDIYTEDPKPAKIQRICAVKGELKERIPLQFHG